jgi:hypothetical protein
MWKDPIVEQVRQAGEEIARKADYDLHTLFEQLRERERQRNPPDSPILPTNLSPTLPTRQ